jgi:hypothetical protein
MRHLVLSKKSYHRYESLKTYKRVVLKAKKTYIKGPQKMENMYIKAQILQAY